MSETFVLSFEHLKGRPKADQALPLLQRIASLVKPIMRKHSWKLPVLAEFFPDSPNLVGLNINHGQKIFLRLRPAHAPDTFSPEDDILHTMLHELTHNVHGPHDDQFYKFLAGLEDEYDALKRSGYAGEGFHSKGTRLGTGASHDLPPHLARQRAIEAAEKRRKISAVLSGGGRLGGGSLARSGLTPREVAALAAERRANDEKACGSGLVAEQEAAKAALDSVKHDVIDLTGDSDSDKSDEIVVVDDSMAGLGSAKSSKTAIRQPKEAASVPSSILARKQSASASSSRSSLNTGPSSSSPAPTTSRPPRSTSSTPSSRQTPAQATWLCTLCTLINASNALQCDACMTPRPQDLSLGWTCKICGEQGMEHQFWTCRFCGSVKDASVV